MKHHIGFSQNFLRNPRHVRNLLSITNINSADIVFDIGGGKGILSDALAKRCHMVISVELDPGLAERLSMNFRGYNNVMVYEADFLSMPLPITPYKVFANIPFFLSADILRRLTEAHNPPSMSYFVVQKEFGNKVVSRPNKYNSQLSNVLGVDFEIVILRYLHPAHFYPRPKVTAVLLEVSRRPEPLVAFSDKQLYRDFVAYTYNACQPSVAATFAHSRLMSEMEFKDMATNILQCPVTATPAQLYLGQWVRMFAILASKYRWELERLVSGYEVKLAQRHSKRVKIHRSR